MVKKVSDSYTEQVHVLRHSHINGYGRLFGGILMQWIDELAAIVAMRHAESEVTTASIDNLNFKSGAYLNDMIVLIGKMTHVGHSSMEIRVDTYIESLNGQRRSINRAYVILVAIDKDGTPICVPELELNTESERAEWESGTRRYQLRKQRRIEGF